MRPDCFSDFGVLDHFKANRKVIFTPGNIIDPDSQSGFMESTLRAMFAGVERQLILQRTQGAKEALRREGKHPNGSRLLPRGVTYDRPTGKWSYAEPWASKVKLAYDLLFQGDSFQTIAQKTGFSTRGIAYSLANPIWCGTRRYDKRYTGAKVRMASGKTRKMQ